MPGARLWGRGGGVEHQVSPLAGVWPGVCHGGCWPACALRCCSSCRGLAASLTCVPHLVAGWGLGGGVPLCVPGALGPSGGVGEPYTEATGEVCGSGDLWLPPAHD